MSVSFFTHMVLGFHLTEDQRWRTDRFRVCQHPEVPGAKFCSECGKPTWKEERDPIESLGDRRFSIHANNTSDFQYANDLGAAAGVEIEIDRGTGHFAVPDPDQWPAIEKELTQVLADLGITPQGDFGLHLVRFVSC